MCDDVTSYVCAVDTGGTFTDCFLIDDEGEVTTAKTLTTHEEGLETGFFRSIDTAAAQVGYDEGEIFDDVIRLAHGTTVATNTVVEGAGVTTGLITTQGHEDSIRMMRGVGRATGEPAENIFRVLDVEKPDPVVSPDLVRGVPERVDSDGEVVAPLDEDAARQAVHELVDAGVEAIAISLLWSFKHPAHERRIHELVDEVAPDVYVSCSHVVAPSVGEYERTVATCLNSIVGPRTARYVAAITARLEEQLSYDGELLLMQCNGGTARSEAVTDTPLTLVGSGPVGGLRGCERLVETVGTPDVIATDMGGTSFELGVIEDGSPLRADETVIRKYRYNLPRLDVKSIGAGGGSIAHIDPDSGSLRVGPRSAGAEPGPACYGRGGEQPTVTDANLLLGYVDPDARLGAEITPDPDLARTALDTLAGELGLTVDETARGIYEVINTKMANLMQTEIIGRGFDPREFALVSYGGAGPIHATAYGSALGIDRVIVPGDISPVWSAYGIAQSDIRYRFDEEIALVEPFDAEAIETAFSNLETQAEETLAAANLDSAQVETRRIAKMRYENQINDLEVRFPAPVTESRFADVFDRFETEYDRRYSPAARLEEARAQIITLRLEARIPVEQFQREEQSGDDRTPPESAHKPDRPVYVGADTGRVPVDVYDGTELRTGNELSGPAIVDMPDTSIVVHEGQTASVTEHRDFELTI